MFSGRTAGCAELIQNTFFPESSPGRIPPKKYADIQEQDGRLLTHSINSVWDIRRDLNKSA